jgi:hypothetical protein
VLPFLAVVTFALKTWLEHCQRKEIAEALTYTKTRGNE